MARTLTARTIETIKPGKARQEIADRYLPGLYLVLQTSGAKSWAVRYRPGPAAQAHDRQLSGARLKAARTIGAKALRAAAEGRDPAARKYRAGPPRRTASNRLSPNSSSGIATGTTAPALRG